MSMPMMFILVTLASLRMASDVTKFEGPLNLYAIAREKVSKSNAPAWVKSGFECVICQSFWWSLLFTFFVPGLSPTEFVLFWLGSAGLISGFFRYIYG